MGARGFVKFRRVQAKSFSKPEKRLPAVHQRKTLCQKCQHRRPLRFLTPNHIFHNPIHQKCGRNQSIRKPDIKKAGMNLINMKNIKHARTQKLLKSIIRNKTFKKTLSRSINQILRRQYQPLRTSVIQQIIEISICQNLIAFLYRRNRHFHRRCIFGNYQTSIFYTIFFIFRVYSL